MPHQILIIEKENTLRSNLGQHLRQEGFKVLETDRLEQALGLLSTVRIGLVLLALEEFRRDGIATMREIRARYPQVKIITINSGEQLELSIESMRLGAYDDFLIPFDLDALISRIQSAVENKPSSPEVSKR